MPKLNPYDKSVDGPVRRFMLANDMTSLRLQTGVTYDKHDPVTNQIIPGQSKSITWDGPVLATNRQDWIESIEKSYAYGDGQIIDMDKLEAEARKAEEIALGEKLRANPEYAKRLKAQLDALEAEKKPAAKEEAKSSFGLGSRSKE